MRAVKVIGTGSYLPERVVSNDEIAPRLGSTSEWILSHTGIESRRVAATDESASTLATAAARSALAAAGIDSGEIALIVVATTTPDYNIYPSTACLVQSALGCVRAAAFDLSAACSGFIYGLEMAGCYLKCHPGEKALVIGSEVLSRTLDWSDRSSAMLFGDGAAAVVLTSEEVASEPLAVTLLGADGNGAQHIRRESGLRTTFGRDPVHESAVPTPVPYLEMDGHAVYSFAVRKLEEVVFALCEKAQTPVESLDLLIAHQANLRILDAVARRMKLPLDKFFLNLQNVGNTSSASIPLCLDQAVRSGGLRPGMRIAMAGFGAGLTWGGVLSQWPFV